MKDVWIILILLLPKINANLSNLTFSRLSILDSQCSKFTDFFESLIGDRDGVRKGIVNVAIADYSNELDINCLIKESLLDLSEKIVIYGITKWTFEYPGIEPDYFVFVQDFSMNKNLSMLGYQYYKYIKSSTKPIVITSFSKLALPSQNVVTDQVSSFFESLNYVNCLMLNIFDNSASLQKYTATLDFQNISNIQNAGINEYYQPLMTNVKINYHELLPFSYLDEDGKKIIAVDGYLIDEFCKQIELGYVILNLHDGQLLKISSTTKIDINFDRKSSTMNFKTHEIANVYETSADRCFLVPRNIPVYRAFANPFDTFVTWLFIMTILLIAFLWKFIKWLRSEELSVVTLAISMLKVFIGLTIDENRWQKWSMKERCLLMPYLFMTIIFVALYQSFLISTLIVEHPMRSVKSVEQLNQSETRIFQYHEDVDRFHDGNIVDLYPKNLSQHAVLILPENYDKNLAYAVRCQFGEDFIRSKWNKQEKRQLFDVIGDPQSRQFYSKFIVAEDFPYKSKFKFTVKSLEEAGVIKFWTKRLVRESFPKHPKSDDDDTTFLGIMIFPFLLIGGGIAISFGFFVLERIHKMFYDLFFGLLISMRILNIFLIGVGDGKRVPHMEKVVNERNSRNSA